MSAYHIQGAMSAKLRTRHQIATRVEAQRPLQTPAIASHGSHSQYSQFEDLWRVSCLDAVALALPGVARNNGEVEACDGQNRAAILGIRVESSFSRHLQLGLGGPRAVCGDRPGCCRRASDAAPTVAWLRPSLVFTIQCADKIQAKKQIASPRHKEEIGLAQAWDGLVRVGKGRRGGRFFPRTPSRLGPKYPNWSHNDALLSSLHTPAPSLPLLFTSIKGWARASRRFPKCHLAPPRHRAASLASLLLPLNLCFEGSISALHFVDALNGFAILEGGRTPLGPPLALRFSRRGPLRQEQEVPRLLRCTAVFSSPALLPPLLCILLTALQGSPSRSNLAQVTCLPFFLQH